jgi:hypothetical protein
VRSKIEFQHQSALISWANARAKLHPELRLLYHVPNGGSRNIREAANLKRAGVRAGVPDLHLPVARGEYHGLWLELKSPTGRTSDAQRDWHAALRDEGHRVEVCTDWIAARDILIAYLSSS